MKRLQNKVAESRHTLWVTLFYSVAVWLLAGLFREEWWIQGGCFLASVFLMIELNNTNLLIRIYSRAVSSAFIILSCAAVFLFPSLPGAIIQLSLIGSLLALFHTYQDKTAVSMVFYTFLCLSIGSLADVFILTYVPLYWLMMAILVYSLSWRTFFASVIGLLTPYWFILAWCLFWEGGDFSYLITHFEQLADWQLPVDYTTVALPQLLFILFTTGLFLTGCIHFVRNSFKDKIRVRQIYYSLMLLGLFSLLILSVQPQEADLTLRAFIIATSPLIGHFTALTNTKVTNVACCVLLAMALLLTALNLWTSSSLF